MKADDSTSTAEDRPVLILSGDGRDAADVARLLSSAGVRVETCPTVDDLCAGIRGDAGAALLTAAALTPAAVDSLRHTLLAQPAWSDFPLLVLTDDPTAAESSEDEPVDLPGYVAVLRRPIHAVTLRSAVLVALRSRRHQFELRDRLREHERRQRELRDRNDRLEERADERAAVAERRAARLRALASELTQAEQRERRRLAEILHDHLQQLLVAAKLNLGAARRRVGGGDVQEILQQVTALLDESIDASRSLAVELCPPVLYDGGLGPALEWLGRRMQDKHGLTVSVDADPEAEPEGDDAKILAFQGVRELLFNVVKHAPRAWARVTTHADGEHHLRICVEDDGPGIDPAIFEREQPPVGGFGLLNVRERLSLLGGRLELDADREQGTCLTLVIPRGRAEEPASPRDEQFAVDADDAAADDGAPRGGIRVLLADDHRIVRQGLVSLLEEQPDIEVVGQASDGLAAVDEALRLRPDVVVMDISMPGLSGIEATRRITRSLPGVRVIGLSLHEEEDVAKSLRDAGAVAYLTKGGPSEALCHAIRAACSVQPDGVTR